MLSKFDKILLDVSGTLYSNKKEPLNGSKEFLKNYYQKIIIFSNIGSKTGLELKEELFNIFNVPIPDVITSLDLLLKFLEKKSYKTIFHYGQENVANKIKPFVGNIVNDISEEDIDAIIFTSLVDSKWIKRTESALNLIIKTDADILLGTQMIAKGIQFNNVSLVAIINTDIGLYLPDFRSGEKIFQLIYQFIGRAKHHSSLAIIQSFNIEDKLSSICLLIFFIGIILKSIPKFSASDLASSIL